MGEAMPPTPHRCAGVTHHLASGGLFAVEIRPGARVEIARDHPDGPVRVVFSDPRPWPSDQWLALTLVLPADVARRLLKADDAGT